MEKILIVEDDAFARRFYERLFQNSSYSVEMAEDGKVGLEKAHTLHPHLILLDIMMPGMSGIKVLEKLKQDPSTKDIHTLMLTNLDDADQIQTAISLGAEGFILKTQYSPEQLKEKLDEFMKEGE